MTENENLASTSGLSRRTVVKAAAWSVPIMAVGSNAPAMAQSPPIVLSLAAACKVPGNAWSSQGYNKGYVFFVDVTNVNIAPFGSIKVTGVTVDGTDQQLVGFSNVDRACGTALNCLTIGLGQTIKIAIYTNGETDSNNALVTGSWTVFQGVGCQAANKVDDYSDSTLPNSTPPWTTGGGSCPVPTGCSAPLNTGGPTITTVSPTSGTANDGIDIIGTNFTGVTSVEIGGEPAIFNILSDTTLVAVVPAAASLGDGEVVITSPTGTVAAPFTVLAAP